MHITHTACEEKQMKQHHVPLLILASLFLFSASAFGEIRVVSVKGTASYKTGGQWVPMQAGNALAVGSKVSTGVKSTAVIRINKHTLTVHPLSIVKISDSVETDRSSTTRIGLRRGSVRAKVDENARIKTVFRVSTPVATSSVRGCELTVGYGPTMGHYTIQHAGATEGTGMNGMSNIIFGKLQFRQKRGSGTPENPMTGMNRFLTRTHPKFITRDEERAFRLFGDDFTTYQPVTRGSLNRSFMVPVKMYLVWPRQ